MYKNSKSSRIAICSRPAKYIMLATTLSLMTACGKVDRLGTVTSSVPFEYKERHPIVLTHKPFTVEIYLSKDHLSVADKERIADLARRYKRNGRGAIMIEFPEHGYRGRGSLNAIRKALAANGARGRLRVSSYPVVDRDIAAPVRISFIGLAAKVASKCGEWPDDLASASSLNSWNNKPYWNLGCSYQTMLAAQTSDPRDLAGPRGETPPDVGMRIRAIGKVREGNDPGTNWKVRNTTISNAGGN